MSPLVFATSNAHKLKEVRQLLPAQIEVIPLSATEWDGDIAETEATLEGNAVLKARTIADALEVHCFAEDTGLEVEALAGAPGVHSARYAGPHRDAQRNMEKLLAALANATDRRAQFRTVVALIIDGATYTFEGMVRGHIAHAPSGSGGFGYDPIFIPDGYDVSFGVLSDEVKNAISHRGHAIRQLVDFLTAYFRCKSPGSPPAQT